MSDSRDSYSRLDYRRMIAWPRRLEREGPLLQRLFASAPAPRLLDLGCGTGEHGRFLAGLGFRVVGIDASRAMLEEARRQAVPGNVELLHGDIAEVAELVEGSFGGAVCLGNTLPHVLDQETLRRSFRGLREVLLAGAALLVQLLNYERVFSRGERYLPLGFRPDGDGELVFLRLMSPQPDGLVLFNPTTLRYRSASEEPLEVVESKSIRLRGWRSEEIERALAEAGFRHRDLLGGFDERPYDPLESKDLLIVAR